MQQLLTNLDYAISMRWLGAWIKELLMSFGVDMATTFGKVINLFIFDVVKIYFMIMILIFINSIIQTYFPIHRTLVYLRDHKGLKSCLIGAVLGMVTHNPTHETKHYFLGLVGTGMTFGAASSIAIASTIMDFVAFVIIWSAFGLEVTVYYTIAAIILAAYGGFIIDNIGHYEHLNTDALEDPEQYLPMICFTRRGRLHFAWHNITHTFKHTWLLIVLFSLIGALVHYAVPTDLYNAVLGISNPFAFLISTAIGIPIYAEIFCTISVAEAMFAAGSGLGTALAFKMGTTALSLPELKKLKADMKPELFRLYIAVIVMIILAMGIIMNYYYVLVNLI